MQKRSRWVIVATVLLAVEESVRAAEVWDRFTLFLGSGQMLSNCASPGILLDI